MPNEGQVMSSKEKSIEAIAKHETLANPGAERIFDDKLIDEIIERVGWPEAVMNTAEKTIEQEKQRRRENLLRWLNDLADAMPVYASKPPTLKDQKTYLEELISALRSAEAGLTTLLSVNDEGKLPFSIKRALTIGGTPKPEETAKNLIQNLLDIRESAAAAVDDDRLDFPPKDAKDAALEQLAILYQRTFMKLPTVNKADHETTGGPFIEFVSLCLPKLQTHPGIIRKEELIKQWERLREGKD